MYDAKKKMIAVVALFLDITERVRVKEQIVDISGREQRRIAHDLHDGLGQELAAIGYRVKALEARMSKNHLQDAGEASKVGTLIAAALSRTRDLVKFLRPVAMDSHGFMQSLRELAQSSSGLYHVDCIFRCPRPVLIPNPDVALHAFRIAQEAVHNAVKHGKPGRVIIGLKKEKGIAELTISNNGIDFKPPRNAKKRGLGLHIMAYRANILHGELTIKRQNPRGTLVKCSFNPNVHI